MGVVFGVRERDSFSAIQTALQLRPQFGFEQKKNTPAAIQTYIDDDVPGRTVKCIFDISSVF